jgi:hypothetical protein
MSPIDPTTMFVHKALSKPPPRMPPTREAIDQLRKEIYANAAAVPSSIGGGNHGHLYVVTTQDQYQAIAGEPYTSPTHPGLNPTYPPTATNAQLAAADRTFKAEEEAHQNMRAVDAAIKAQLVKAISPDYLAALQDRILGFTNVTSLQIIQHLENTYGGYTRDGRKKNEAKLMKPWDPATETLELYWQRIEDCRAYATEANDPISDIRTMEIIANNFESTEVFPDYMKDWNKKPETDQTYENLKAHFTAANKDRLRTVTTQGLGYAGAATRTRSETTQTTDHPTILKEAERMLLEDYGLSYCHSHGMCRAGHNSRNCAFKLEGHKEEATLLNRLGGSTRTFMRPPTGGGRGGGRGTSRGGRGNGGRGRGGEGRGSETPEE